MKLGKADQEFRNTKVFYPDPKNIELDRVLVRLYLHLRCNGMRPMAKTHYKPSWEQVEHHRVRLSQKEENIGFGDDGHPTIARAWLESDVFDVINRGKGVPLESIASLRPLHLDATKIHFATRCRDYNVADHVYRCLKDGDDRVIDALKAYLDRGRDRGSDGTALGAGLDLETRALLKLVQEDAPSFQAGRIEVAPDPVVCVGQARVLCDDIRRLLAYQDAVPRSVMIEYLRTVIGLHTALYILRLARQLNGWIADGQAHAACRNCPVQGAADQPFAECPYGIRLATDMGDNYRSRMARLAQASAAAEWGRTDDLVRAIFSVNQLLRYAKAKGLPAKDSPAAAVDLLSNPPSTFEGFFEAMLDNFRQANTTDGTLPADIEAILTMEGPAFTRFIELITHVRYRHHRNYLNQLLDKLLQKNTDYAAAVQGRSGANPRRWHLRSRLLELFVQLAVLKVDEVDGRRRYVARPLLIDNFVHWVEHRYGFVLAGSIDPEVSPTLEEHAAFRQNIAQLKLRLREIGFFEDLSDAFNAQTIRPRYSIQAEAQE